MSFDTSFTQADIEALEASMKRGVLTVQYGERSVTYQTTSEMLKLLQQMKDSVAASSSGGRGGRIAYGQTSKGPGGGSRFGL